MKRKELEKIDKNTLIDILIRIQNQIDHFKDSPFMEIGDLIDVEEQLSMLQEEEK